ncbi:MAG: hypothetical protein JSS68_04400 [Actinobacteria bacterium]|nr:hypothetical protein [Actinomycetota bacterium]
MGRFRWLRIGAVGSKGLVAAASAAIVVGGLYVVAGPTGSVGGAPLKALGPAPPKLSAAVVAQVAALERTGLDPTQATRGIETQEAIDEAALVSKLEAALGGAFAGVWLDPRRATLHVGVTSRAARATVESMSAAAGLSAHVAETKVSSTWKQLTATQRRWDRRLSGLLLRSQVGTSLSPEANAVVVELSSAAAPALRARLKHSALASPVHVMLTSVPPGQLTVELQASRCEKWAELKAYCNPTIAAGVLIESEVNKEQCTAGPAVLTEHPDTNTTDTFILTAGHCVTEGGGLLSAWRAFDKNGTPQKLGEAVEYLDDAKGDAVDVAAIEVENAHWITPTQTPVHPGIAPWGALEPEPFAVEGSVGSVIGHTSCVEGARTGFHCGTIVSVTAALAGLKNLVEVEGVETNKGDSGAPWYSAVEGPSFDYVEGTHVGKTGAGHPVFEPLAASLKELADQAQEYNLELLTTANETRPECPMPGTICFEAETYPATITGSELKSIEVGTESGSIACGTASYSGSLAEASKTLEVSPGFGECTIFGTPLATTDINGCKFKFTATSKVEADKYKGAMDIACPAGASIKFTSVCGCVVTVGSQTALATIEYVDATEVVPKEDADFKVTVTGLKYTEEALCKHPGTRSSGTYSAEITVKADTGGGSAQDFRLSG